jgi:hypothetical protein
VGQRGGADADAVDAMIAPAMTTQPDDLLAALDHFTNAVCWLGARAECTADQAVIEAVDDWLGEHAAEYHQSNSFTDATGPDDLGTVLIHLAAAVTHLRRHHRPDLTVTTALSEALHEWAAELSAEHHRSQPFQRSTPRLEAGLAQAPGHDQHAD